MLRLNADMKSTAVLTIGEVAERFGLTTHVLRHWESVGLLAPARAEGARRRYGPDDLVRVAAILRAKEGGLGLEDIRQVLTARNPLARREVLRRRHAELVRRIAEAQAALEMVECALGCEHEDFTQCDHFRARVQRHHGVGQQEREDDVEAFPLSRHPPTDPTGARASRCCR